MGLRISGAGIENGELGFKEFILIAVLAVTGMTIYIYGKSHPSLSKLPVIMILLFVIVVVAGLIVAKILEIYGFI